MKKKDSVKRWRVVACIDLLEVENEGGTISVE